MTDTHQNGSGASDATQTGTPEGGQKTEEKGSASGSETPFSGLSEGTRKWVETKGYKSLDDLAAAGMNLETKVGSMVSLPGEKATPEELNAFYSKVGRPETADKYDFKKPEGLPEGLPYNDDMAKAAKTWMHEAGLSPRQAQTVHDHFAKFMGEQSQAQMKNLAGNVEKAHDELVKEWGPLEGEKFKTNLTLANRALKKLGLEDVLKAHGVMLPDGAITDAQLAKAFASVGGAMFKEDTLEGGSEAQGGENPFKRDEQGHIKSITAISALIKSDPEKAKRLAREAGEPYENWVSPNPL